MIIISIESAGEKGGKDLGIDHTPAVLSATQAIGDNGLLLIRPRH